MPPLICPNWAMAPIRVSVSGALARLGDSNRSPPPGLRPHPTCPPPGTHAEATCSSGATKTPWSEPQRPPAAARRLPAPRPATQRGPEQRAESCLPQVEALKAGRSIEGLHERGLVEGGGF